MEKVNINLEKGVKKIEVFEGQSLEIKPPLKVEVKGLIDSPFKYLEKRISELSPKKCMVIADVSNQTIKLIVDEKEHYNDTITGVLKINPEFEKFGINSGTVRDTFELADFIKMNRFYFKNKSVAMKLVSELKNFKAKVDNQIELSNNDRGNTRFLKNQVVESNIPEGFDLSIPIFKGASNEVFQVEININASDFGCTLISPVANDIIKELSEKQITEQLSKIEQLSPDLVIIHQ